MSDQTIHKNPDLITKLSQNLNVYRKENKLCDFTIKSNDGKILSVHKNVLISASTFFEKMFDSGMREVREDSMVLDKISGENLERIVEYMYTGSIEVTFENAREIYGAALFLGFDDLIEFSTKVLIGGIKNENVCSLLKFGKTTMTDDLKNACFKWIFENLEVVNKLKDVENLCFDTIKEIMERKNEFYLCEDKFHTIIMKWVKFDDQTRKCHAKELIESLRFDFMSKEYLMSDEILETADLIDDRNFLTKIIEICLEYDERKYKRLKLSSLSPVACSTLNGNSLYVVTENNIYKFDPNIQNLTKHCILPCMSNATFKCFGDGNGSFFIIIHRRFGHMRDWCNEIKIYSKKKEEWIDIPNVNKSVDSYGVYYKNKIFLYIFSLKMFQIFDLINYSWIGQATAPADITALCTLNDQIYVYGSEKGKPKLYCSDESLSSWECLTTLSNMPKIQKVVGYDNYIYHFGETGYCIFDLKMELWFNDFDANEEDLEYERKGIQIPFFQRANNCFLDQLKNEWNIKTKPYHENMKFEDVCLHENKFYVTTDGNIVQVYKAPSFDFIRKFEIPISQNEDKSIKFLISN